MQEKGWEDFKVGDKFVTPSVTVTETHIVNFGCLTGDWYPLHFNEEFAKKTIFKGRIAHGPLTFSFAIGLMFQSGVFGDSIAASLGIDKMRALKPVRAGDTIRVEADVIDKKETSKAEQGITIMVYNVKDQRDETVFTFEYTILMYRRK